MKSKNRALCASLVLALTACGGGGSSSPPPSGGGGTPPPSPPPITYTKFADLTGNQNFRTACSGVQLIGGFANAIPASTLGNGLGTSFTAASQIWTITRQDNGVVADFQPSEIVQSPKPGFTLYRGPNFFDLRDDLFFLGQGNIMGQQADYLRGFNLIWYILRNDSDIENNFCVFGVPTDAADTLPAASTQYLAKLDAVAFVGTAAPYTVYDLSISRVTLETTQNPREIAISLELKGIEIDSSGNLSNVVTEFEDFTGTATVPVGQTGFSGTLSNAALSQLNGAFAGSYFGPQGTEAGLALNAVFQRADGNTVVIAGMMRAKR